MFKFEQRDLGKKRRHSMAMTRLFNEIYRKISQLKMTIYFFIILMPNAPIYPLIYYQ